jgi:excisionase family DNA binding protein
MTTEPVSGATRSDVPAFYTVREAARILRVDPATIYRAIRENAFPAVRIRNRYIVPAAAVERMAADAAASGSCVDVGRMTVQRRLSDGLASVIGGGPR